MLRSIVVAFALTFPALGQTPPAAPPPAKAPFVFEAGVQELRPLVNRCASYLQRNILLDPRELEATKGNARRQGGAQGQAEAVNPTFELQLPIVTDRDGCEEMLQSLLWTEGLALVPLDEAKGVYEVLAMAGPRAREITQRAAPRTVAEVLARPRLRSWVLVAMPLQHANASMVTNSLRPFFASTGSQPVSMVIGNSGDTSTILLCGPQDTVASAIQVLQVTDVAQGEEIAAQASRFEQLANRMAELERRVAAIDGQTKPTSAPTKASEAAPAEKETR